MTDAPVEPVLRVERLSYTYPNGFRALDEVSFSVSNGEKLAVVGPSGAGKSTLLMHLNGLLPEKIEPSSPASNSVAVHIGDLPMVKEHLPEIRRRVGFLFQDPDDQLFCPTVREDVAFGPLNLGLSQDEVRRRVAESLKAVDLEEYDDRSTLQLSLGERKRVCLAGVLACEPSVLALDEPSSNLDPRARRGLIEILGSSSSGQIIATHDLDLVVEHCNRVIVLDEGRIQADGTPVAILSDEALMQRHGLEVPMRIRYSGKGTSDHS